MNDTGCKAGGQIGDGLRDTVTIAVVLVKDETPFIVIQRKTYRRNGDAVAGKVDRQTEATVDYPDGTVGNGKRRRANGGWIAFGRHHPMTMRTQCCDKGKHQQKRPKRSRPRRAPASQLVRNQLFHKTPRINHQEKALITVCHCDTACGTNRINTRAAYGYTNAAASLSAG